MANVLYYTIDEYIGFLTTELRNLNVLLQMFSAMEIREREMTSRGDDFATIETIIEGYMVDADSFLTKIITALAALNLNDPFAHEVRVGAIIHNTGGGLPGNYHHAIITVNGFTNWTITSVNAEDVAVDAFDVNIPATGVTGLFLAGDQVEISGIGNPFLEGIFTVYSEDSDFITLEETNDPEAVAVSDVFGVVVRLRER